SHTHFIYQLTSPKEIKEVQKEFNLKKTGDYLISIKNPIIGSQINKGVSEERKIVYPSYLQEKFNNYRFIPLNDTEFLDYEGCELLLIATGKENLQEREKEISICLEKIVPDEMSSEFAKIISPDKLIPIKE